jgi:hypothetical protein
MTPHDLAPPRAEAAGTRASWLAGALCCLLCAAGLGVPSSASAALTISAVPGGGPSGGNARENFDGLTIGGTSGQTTPTGLKVNFTSGAAAVTGSLAGVYSAPVLSGNNGLGFGAGGNDQALGPNATPYLTTRSAADFFGTVELLLPGDSKYFGLLWGSIENDNLLQLFDGSSLVGTVTGVDVTATFGQTRYVNLNSTLAFDRVVLSSSRSTALEFDNVAFDAAVPLPGTLALATLGLLGLGASRRARTR